MGLADAISSLVDSITAAVAGVLESLLEAMDSLNTAIEDSAMRYLTEWAPWREREIALTYGGRIRVRYIDPDDHAITANKIPGVNLGG